MSKILIIDDNPTVTGLYGLTLRNAGYSVDVAHDGDAGLAAVARFRPDIVLLDLSMPKTDGLQVLAAIRADPQSTSLPVIVFSNTYTTERLQQVWDAGATHVLAKASSTPRLVKETVQSVLAASVHGKH